MRYAERIKIVTMAHRHIGILSQLVITSVGGMILIILLEMCINEEVLTKRCHESLGALIRPIARMCYRRAYLQNILELCLELCLELYQSLAIMNGRNNSIFSLIFLALHISYLDIQIVFNYTRENINRRPLIICIGST